MSLPTKLVMIEQCRVEPYPASASRPSLLLTFFDIVFLRFPPVQRIFFYEYPHPEHRFLASELPNLKHSLSLALHHFYPLAGTLFVGGNPEIRCSDRDSIPCFIARSGDDFHKLLGDHPRDVTDFHSLVPPLPPSGDDKNAILAIQLTVFPNVGIAIGTTIHHAVADGSTYAHFMKTWASLCNSANSTSLQPLPFYDRAVVCDPKGLDKIFLKDMEMVEEQGRSLEAWDLSGRSDVVLATFAFGRAQLDMLGSKTSAQCSPYSLACGYMWACLVRARTRARANTHRKTKTEYFGFVTGCRARIDPQLPATYFGNCLGICHVKAKRSELLAERGAAVAAEAIWEVISGLGKGVFKRVENWIQDVFDCMSVEALTVAGSPKLRLYEVDFGWGRPRKVENVSIERTGALSIAESRDGSSGIEVGLALPRDQMEDFISIFAGERAMLNVGNT